MNSALFGLLLAMFAGLTTVIGSMEVFFIKQINASFFAVCMAFSAGVMAYISFAEMLPTSYEYFKKALDQGPTANLDFQVAWRIAIAFFIGWTTTILLDIVLTWAMKDSVEDESATKLISCSSTEIDSSNQTNVINLSQYPGDISVPSTHTTDGIHDIYPVYTEAERKSDIKHQHEMSNSYQSPRILHSSPDTYKTCLEIPEKPLKYVNGLDKDRQERIPASINRLKENIYDIQQAVEALNISPTPNSRQHQFLPFWKKPFRRLEDYFLFDLEKCTKHELKMIHLSQESFLSETKKHRKLGICTAIVLAVHNFPEGLASYAAGLANTQFGLGVAISIGAHNIPEGLAVAIPIYYGTRNRWKGFMYGSLSGLAEPAGALLAHFVCGGKIDDYLMGWTIALLSGIMMSVSLRGLYSDAIRYDPANQYTTSTFLWAMVFIACTILALKYFDL